MHFHLALPASNNQPMPRGVMRGGGWVRADRVPLTWSPQSSILNAKRALGLQSVPRPGVHHLTRSDASLQPLQFMGNLGSLSHMVPDKAQRLLSETRAGLWGWKCQDFEVTALSHSFLIKMLLHHWKFLSVPTDFSLVIEPLVKGTGLEPQSSPPLWNH